MKQIESIDTATLREKYEINDPREYKLIDTSLYEDGPKGLSDLIADAEKTGCEKVVFVSSKVRYDDRLCADMLTATEKETGKKALIVYVTSPDAVKVPEDDEDVGARVKSIAIPANILLIGAVAVGVIGYTARIVDLMRKGE